jgi:3-dehydroquinate synthase
MSEQSVILCTDFKEDLTKAVTECNADKIFVLTDEHTHALCFSTLENLPIMKDAKEIVIKAGDTHKDIQTLSYVWKCLSDEGATRHSLLINLGGGMVTDLGGFAASSFKRGFDFINVPTTLLAMVDASVGGKTGINFNGLKNEIGVFNTAHCVLINAEFLHSLDTNNFFSGYAEMLKHGLISDTNHWSQLLNFDTNTIDYHLLAKLVDKSIQVKENIVAQDPREQGIRKALNFGHTFGHAFESLSLSENRPILHGYAVAYGIVCELYLSCVNTEFPKDKMHQTIHFIKENYGRFSFTCKEYDKLYYYMLHDKKNVAGFINCTLLHDIGDIKINQRADKDTIFETLDFYRECME